MRHALLAYLGFHSVDRAFLASIDSIRWFDNCGQSAEFDVPLPCEPVHSWAEAMSVCDTPDRRDNTLEARNALTSYLFANCPAADRHWNRITGEAKKLCVLPLARDVWQPFAQAHSLDKSIVDATSWNVLAAIMEHEYRNCAGRPVFFLHLLEIYRRGHFPCGWVGTWPSGKLLYF